MFGFLSLEPVEEYLKSRSIRSFHYLKDIPEVGLICIHNSYLIEIQIISNSFMHFSLNLKFK